MASADRDRLAKSRKNMSCLFKRRIPGLYGKSDFCTYYQSRLLKMYADTGITAPLATHRRMTSTCEGSVSGFSLWVRSRRVSAPDVRFSEPSQILAPHKTHSDNRPPLDPSQLPMDAWPESTRRKVFQIPQLVRFDTIAYKNVCNVMKIDFTGPEPAVAGQSPLGRAIASARAAVLPRKCGHKSPGRHS